MVNYPRSMTALTNCGEWPKNEENSKSRRYAQRALSAMALVVCHAHF